MATNTNVIDLVIKETNRFTISHANIATFGILHIEHAWKARETFGFTGTTARSA